MATEHRAETIMDAIVSGLGLQKVPKTEAKPAILQVNGDAPLA